MKKEHAIIIKAISDLLVAHPELRFGQALFNLNINQFYPDGSEPRDIFYDTDEIIVKRLRKI